MKVSRSGYYKWLKNKENLNNYELNRKDLGILIKDIHTRKPSYGYHRINAIIRRETGWIVSDNLVHKVCKLLNIKSKARHYKYKKSGEESIKYSNQICGNWNTTRPFEKIVSDTTTFWFRKRKYDWTFYLDVFNNEINITAEVHPNPADNLLILKIDNIEEDYLNFIIFDIQGTLVKKESIYQRLTLIDLSEFAPNVYFLKINNNKKNELKVFKIIKK